MSPSAGNQLVCLLTVYMHLIEWKLSDWSFLHIRQNIRIKVVTRNLGYDFPTNGSLLCFWCLHAAWFRLARCVDIKWSCWMAFEFICCIEAEIFMWRLLAWLPYCSLCSKANCTILFFNRICICFWYKCFLDHLYSNCLSII